MATKHDNHGDTQINSLESSRRVFRREPFPPIVLIHFIAAYGLVMLVIAVFGARNFAKEGAVGIGIAISLPAIPLVFAAWLNRCRKRSKRDGVVISDDGVTVIRQEVEQTHRWSDVQSISRGEFNSGNAAQCSTYPFFVLRKVGGSIVKIGSPLDRILGHAYDDMGQLSERIEELAHRHLLPKLLARFDAGETLDFSVLRADRSGLTCKGQFLSWSQCSGFCRNVILINGGGATDFVILRADTDKAWKHFPLIKVTNALVLIALIERFSSK